MSDAREISDRSWSLMSKKGLFYTSAASCASVFLPPRNSRPRSGSGAGSPGFICPALEIPNE